MILILVQSVEILYNLIRVTREIMQRLIFMRLAAAFAFAIGALAGSIKDIKHVVLFMQENRAFDHVSCIIPLKNAQI